MCNVYVVRFIVDGAAHSVDSNELAFKLAAKGAFRQVHSLDDACDDEVNRDSSAIALLCLHFIDVDPGYGERGCESS
jgi:hypothetical protein